MVSGRCSWRSELKASGVASSSLTFILEYCIFRSVGLCSCYLSHHANIFPVHFGGRLFPIGWTSCTFRMLWFHDSIGSALASVVESKDGHGGLTTLPKHCICEDAALFYQYFIRFCEPSIMGRSKGHSIHADVERRSEFLLL